MSYTFETLYEIWDDKTGNKIEVGPDRDALDLIEIRAIEDGKRVSDITLTREQAALVSKALQALLENGNE
jgi:hypothetical protein